MKIKNDPGCPKKPWSCEKKTCIQNPIYLPLGNSQRISEAEIDTSGIDFKTNSLFLDAILHLYKRVCQSIRLSVRPSVRLSLRPSVGHTQVVTMQKCCFWQKLLSVRARTHIMAVYPALFSEKSVQKWTMKCNFFQTLLVISFLSPAVSICRHLKVGILINFRNSTELYRKPFVDTFIDRWALGKAKGKTNTRANSVDIFPHLVFAEGKNHDFETIFAKLVQARSRLRSIAATIWNRRVGYRAIRSFARSFARSLTHSLRSSWEISL